MNKKSKRTVRLRRPSRSSVDERGQTVWEGPEVDTDFELLSTQRLMQILTDGDEQRQSLEALADEDREGVVAQRAGSDTFEIIDDDDLMAAIQSAEDDENDENDEPPLVVDDETFAEEVDPEEPAGSLVSTMALRRILNQDGDPELVSLDKDGEILRDAGFDPRKKS